MRVVVFVVKTLKLGVKMVWPALIAAGASLVGGALNSRAQDVAAGRAQDQANNQMALQQEFALKGLTWRANDAMRAYKETGIHPLAMLGVQGPSYTPVNMVGGANTAMGDAIGSAGQGISRAMLAAQSEETRRDAVKPLLDLQLERGNLENHILRLRIASEEARMVQSANPAMPIGPTINHPGVERKIIDDVSVARTPRGGYVVLPGKEAQSRMEEIFGLGPEWFARNRAWLASANARAWVKKFLPPAPANMEYRYNVPTGEWLPEYINYPDRHLPDTSTARGVRRYIGYEAPNYLTR